MTKPIIPDHHIAFVKEHYKTRTAEEIAALLTEIDGKEVSVGHIQYICRYEGIRKYEPWNEQKTRLLQKHAAMGMRSGEIAKRLNVCQKSIWNHAKDLGITLNSASGRNGKPNRPGK